MKTVFAAMAAIAIAAPGAAMATCAGPDLAVVDVKLSEIAVKQPNTFDFEVSCTVQNIGLTNFVSKEGIQGIHLYEKVADDPEPRRLKYRHFDSVEMGESLKVSKFILSWPTADIAALPEFVCAVEYDAEVAKDDMVSNDDCDASNNMQSVGGAEVHQILSQSNAGASQVAPSDFMPKKLGDTPFTAPGAE